MKELYHEEQRILFDFSGKVKGKKLNMRDATNFISHYSDLLEQSKVITKISDRLQKKLDLANQKIQSQNQEIQKKNTQLETTVKELIHMTVGKKAFRIMFMVAIVLFISEEYYLEPIIERHVEIPFLSIGIKIFIAIFLRIFEGWLEGHFLHIKMSEILGHEEYRERVIKPKLQKLQSYRNLKIIK
ncbi:hypothetical protein [Reichenbachiella sp. MALMAid0571]|uniref:hypothetical protein n=1 Tax=Reichenbachiella sp. MALMAid0571 TaxID=3143939 RepID=UPI0032DEAB60